MHDAFNLQPLGDTVDLGVMQKKNIEIAPRD
jgi:hypothetical protein